MRIRTHVALNPVPGVNRRPVRAYLPYEMATAHPRTPGILPSVSPASRIFIKRRDEVQIPILKL